MALSVADASTRVVSRMKVLYGAQSYGFDPISLVTILLPILIKCFMKEDEPDPAQVKASMERACRNEKKHQRTRLRIAKQAESTARREQNKRITRGEALQVADGVIAEALATDTETVAGLCSSVRAA